MCAETILISPIVSSREIDETTLQAGIEGIGAAVVGRTQKGPAFKVGTVHGWADFEGSYGTLDTTLTVPYAAKEYLKNQNVLNVVRVLGVHSDEYAGGDTTKEAAGFTASMALAVCNSSSAGGWQVATIIHTKQTVTATGTLQSMVFDWSSGYNNGNPFTGSYVRTDKNYVEKIINLDPTKYDTTSYQHYIWQNFAYNSSSIQNSSIFSGTYAASTGVTFSQEYSTAATSWIYSQNFGTGMTGSDVIRYRLFRLVAKDDGEWPNSNIKASVVNMRNTINTKATEYGYFDVVVRNFDDTDKKSEIVEQFTNCTLDPDDTVGYVARKIGDKYSTWDTTTKKFIESGEFDSMSKYIRVELDEQVTNKMVPATSLPWGFYGYPKYPSGTFAILSVSFGDTVVFPGAYPQVPNLPYTSQMTWKGDFDSKICWGVAFNDSSGNFNYGIEDRMKVLPSGITTPEYDRIFTLDYLSSSEGSKTSSTALTSSAAQSKVYYSHEAGNCAFDSVVGTTLAKFSLPFYGGFDGFNIMRTNPIDNAYMGSGQDNTSTSAWDTAAYLGSYEVCSVRRAVDILGCPELVDFNLLVIPGIFHPGVVNYAVQKVEDRGDCFYILDVSGSTVTYVKSWMDTAEFDTSYGACYYPYVKYFDEVNNKDIWLPPSISAFGAYAYNDRIGTYWAAPAGFNRASINAKDVKDRTTYLERNDLVSKNVNPIARFPQEGIVIFAQNTLQATQSALSSINVRRLMLYLRKTIASATRFLLFEPNVATTWDRFVKIVDPILHDVFIKYGVTSYKIVMDETTNTPEAINAKKMYGKIFIQPTRVAEILQLDFVISPQGATF